PRTPRNRWLGVHAAPEGGRLDATDPGHRALRPRHGRRSREGARRGLRRLRHQADRLHGLAAEDGATAHARGSGPGSRIGAMTTGGQLMDQTNVTLLLVDDDAMNRDALQRRLARKGYNVLTAESGPHALATVSSNRVDAVLLDVMMPGMSGIETL